MTINESREAAFLRDTLSDPAWLLQQLDHHSDRAAFLRVSEATYRQSPFLDHRLQAPRQQPVITRLGTLVDAAASRQGSAMGWIFHLGHVGSTLLSRLLGELEPLLPVREPVPLRTLAGLYREQDHPLALLSRAEYERWERAMFNLLGRTFTSAQQALVKATSDCCILMERALEANAGSRVVWLHVDLETFLAGMLRNDLRKEETRGFAQTRLWDLHDLLDDQSIRLHQLDLARVTAVSWLANQGHWLKVQRAGRGDRVLPVHFHDLLDDLEGQLRVILQHLHVPADGDALERMTRSRWREAYAKDPRSRFSAGARYRQLEASRGANAIAIEDAMAFAEDLCGRFEILDPLKRHLRSRAAPPDSASGKSA